MSVAFGCWQRPSAWQCCAACGAADNVPTSGSAATAYEAVVCWRFSGANHRRYVLFMLNRFYLLSSASLCRLPKSWRCLEPMQLIKCASLTCDFIVCNLVYKTCHSRTDLDGLGSVGGVLLAGQETENFCWRAKNWIRVAPAMSFLRWERHKSIAENA